MLSRLRTMKKQLLFLFLIVISWYNPGVVNKTLNDLKELLQAVKALFL